MRTLTEEDLLVAALEDSVFAAQNALIDIKAGRSPGYSVGALANKSSAARVLLAAIYKKKGTRS